MNTERKIHIAVIAAALAVSVVGARAWGFAAPASGGGAAVPHEIDTGLVKLSPIVVDGRHVPFPIALQMVKKALKRPYSSHPKDKNKLVCRFEHIFASHLETLMCETNAQYFSRASDTQAAIEEGESQSYHDPSTGQDIDGMQVALERGYFDSDIGNFMDTHPINRGALMTILHNLPPANASYTLRVLDHGKPVLEYVIKNGELVAIRKPQSKAQSGGR